MYALDQAMAIYNVETMNEHVRAAYVCLWCGHALWEAGEIGLVLATVSEVGNLKSSRG